MPSLADYFEKNRPHPKWHIGDRVFGHFRKKPFVGTVLIDSKINDESEARVLVHLDLPLVLDAHTLTMVSVAQKDIKRLIKY